MSYFLTNQILKIGTEAELAGEEVRHVLLSRRMKKGEQFELQDKQGSRFVVEITQAQKNSLKFNVVKTALVPPEPEISVSLYQSMVNEKALDFILQKSTELGASRIVLFNSQNTAVRISSEVFNRKKGRWEKILWEAAKQSGRQYPPVLGFVEGVSELIDNIKALNKVFLADISGIAIKSLLQNQQPPVGAVGLLIGPEGGFTDTEVEKFKSLPNCTTVTLGPILLRAETAALSSLSLFRNLL